MNNEKKIEIPAMPEKYRIMLEMLPEEPAGSKEEQAVRWKLRSAILDAYSAELRGKDVGGGVAILALLTGMLREEAKKPEQDAEKTPDPTANPAEGIDGEAMLRVRDKVDEAERCHAELQDAECEWCNLIPELVNSAAEKEAWTRLVTADERMRRTRSQLRRMAKIAMGYITE
nr:MAG TPA: hypothetical protein [Caudoviricetes sp.]